MPDHPRLTCLLEPAFGQVVKVSDKTDFNESKSWCGSFNVQQSNTDAESTLGSVKCTRKCRRMYTVGQIRDCTCAQSFRVNTWLT